MMFSVYIYLTARRVWGLHVACMGELRAGVVIYLDIPIHPSIHPSSCVWAVVMYEM